MIKGSAGTTGTSGADTFTAAATADAATTTYNTTDVLVGGDGTDVLNIAATAAVGRASSVVGIETINVNTTGMFSGASFDAGGVVGVGTTINVSTAQAGGDGSFAITNLGTGAVIGAAANVTGTLAVTTTAAAAQEVTLLANKAGTQTLTLHGTTGTTDTATVTAAGTVGLTTNGTSQIETVSLSGNGAAATYTITGAPTTINLTGSQSVTVAGDGDNFQAKTISDATTAGTTTLKLTADTTAGADLSKIGTDVIELAFASAAATYTVKAGQALKVSTANTAAMTLDLSDNTTTNITGAASVDLGVALHSSGLALDATASSDNITALSLTNSTADQSFVLAAGALADVTVSGTKALTLTNTSTAKSIDATGLSGVLTATANATNSKITGGSGNDVITVATATTVTVNGGAGTDTLKVTTDITGLTATDIEIINLAGGVTLSKASQWSGKTYAITDAGTTNIEISALDASTIDLSGLTFQAASTIAVNNANTVNVLDAAKFVSTQGLTVIGSSVVDTVVGTGNADNISGGLGADVLKGGAGADVIDGGAGADAITGGTGADAMTGGAGADKFVIAITDGSAVGTAGGTFSGFDTITDFTTASDTIAVYAGAATDTSAGLQAAVDAKAVVFANNQTVNGTAVTTLAAADFTDVTKVLAFITATNNGTAAANLDFVVVVNDATAGKHAMYAVDNAATNGFTAGEVRLLAINTGVAVTADFIA